MHDVVLLEKWAQTNCNNNFYDVLLQNIQNPIIHSYLHNKRDRESEDYYYHYHYRDYAPPREEKASIWPHKKANEGK